MVRPRFDRWWITRFTQPLSCLTFALGALLSWRTFPRPFDWHRMVISALLSPHDNPGGYGWIAVGMAISGLLMMPLGGYLRRALRPLSAAGAHVIRALLVCGGSGMMIIAACADAPIALRVHNTLAVLTFCMLLGALVTTALLLARHPDRTRLALRGSRTMAWLPALIIAPIAGTVSTQLVVLLSRPPLLQPLPDWFNIAFWEWILAGLVYAGGWTLAWLTAGEEPR